MNHFYENRHILIPFKNVVPFDKSADVSTVHLKDGGKVFLDMDDRINFKKEYLHWFKEQPKEEEAPATDGTQQQS